MHNLLVIQHGAFLLNACVITWLGLYPMVPQAEALVLGGMQ